MQKTRPKVAIVYQYFAHYRRPIIEELSTSNEFDFYFIGDTSLKSPSDNQKLYLFPDKRNFISVKNHWFLKVFLWQKGLLKALKENDFDSVIFLGDWKYFSTWIAVLQLRRKKTPSLFWSHGLLNRTKSFNNKIKMIFLGLFSHGGFVYDNRAKNNMLESGFKNEINVIYNSLDFTKQRRIVQTLENNPSDAKIIKNKPYLILTGRLDARKRIELLFEAIKSLQLANENIDVILVGEGDHKHFLKSYAEELGILNKVHFYGSCYDETELAHLYMNSLVCVIPSAVGLSAIHSLTYMTPVITSDDINSHGPEIEAIIDYKTGRFFKHGDSESLADKILYFKYLSKADLNKYRSECLQIIEQKYNPMVQSSIISKRLKVII